MVPICTEWWCMEANEATRTHCYNPVAPAYPIWAYYAHGRQRRCQEDPVSLLSGRLEKTTRSSPHHVAQHRPTGSETTPPYAPWSRRFGSEPPSVEDDVDVWHYAIVTCMPETTMTVSLQKLLSYIKTSKFGEHSIPLSWYLYSNYSLQLSVPATVGVPDIPEAGGGQYLSWLCRQLWQVTQHLWATRRT